MNEEMNNSMRALGVKAIQIAAGAGMSIVTTHEVDLSVGLLLSENLWNHIVMEAEGAVDMYDFYELN